MDTMNKFKFIDTLLAVDSSHYDIYNGGNVFRLDFDDEYSIHFNLDTEKSKIDIEISSEDSTIQKFCFDYMNENGEKVLDYYNKIGNFLLCSKGVKFIKFTDFLTELSKQEK